MKKINGKKVFFPSDTQQIIDQMKKDYRLSPRQKILNWLIRLREKLEKDVMVC